MAGAAESLVKCFDVWDAWLEPDGKLHDIGCEMHYEWAEDNQGVCDSELERRGWVRLSSCEWYAGIRGLVTQAQFDTIFDWYIANGFEDDFRPQEFEVRQ